MRKWPNPLVQLITVRFKEYTREPEALWSLRLSTLLAIRVGMSSSGYLVPLEALPRWVRGAADVLPFRFMLGFPVETLVGLLGPARGAARARRAVGLRGVLRAGGARRLARGSAPVLGVRRMR